MSKRYFLTAIVALTLLFMFAGCNGNTRTTSNTSNTSSTQSTTQTTSTSQTTSTTSTTGTARDIIIELDIVGSATYGLIGIGNLEATGTSKEIVITGNIYNIRNANANVTIKAEFFDSSGVYVGYTEVKMILFGAIDPEFRQFEIKYIENPVPVASCLFTVTAYEGVE
jgi:hypothetical protein